MTARLCRLTSIVRAPIKKGRRSDHRTIPWRTNHENPCHCRCCGQGHGSFADAKARADTTEAEPLLDEIDPKAFIADKAYDADPLIEKLEERQITPVVFHFRMNRDFRSMETWNLYPKNGMTRSVVGIVPSSCRFALVNFSVQLAWRSL
ncbi:transposase [Gluconobacter sp. Dm-73]|nr:transposase [Gluconobacter sp. Dm-73]